MNDLDQKIFSRLVDRFGYPSHIAKDMVERGPVFDHHLNDYLLAKHGALHELARARVERENDTSNKPTDIRVVVRHT